MDFDPQPDKNQLRLAVEDNRTAMAGTLEAPAPQESASIELRPVQEGDGTLRCGPESPESP